MIDSREHEDRLAVSTVGSVWQWQNHLRAMLADAILCAQIESPAKLRTLFSMGGWHGRFEAGFRALGKVLPNAMKRVAFSYLVPVTIEGNSRDPTPIGRGRAVTVFGFGNHDAVVKVYRHSMGLGAQQLSEFEGAVRCNLDHMEEFYGEIPELLLPSVLEIATGPILGLPAVVLRQPRITQPIEDFFLDHTDQELLNLLRKNPRLNQQFIGFAKATRRSLRQGTLCFDMYGRDNLMLLSDSDGPRLAIGDIGVYDLAERERKVPAIYRNIEALHQRLFSLLDAMQQRD